MYGFWSDDPGLNRNKYFVTLGGMNSLEYLTMSTQGRREKNKNKKGKGKRKSDSQIYANLKPILTNLNGPGYISKA